MEIIFILTGLAVGLIQYCLLNVVIQNLSVNVKKTALALSAKALIYAAVLTVLFIWFKDSMIYAGIGFGVGLTLTSLITFVLRLSKLKGKK